MDDRAERYDTDTYLSRCLPLSAPTVSRTLLNHSQTFEDKKDYLNPQKWTFVEDNLPTRRALRFLENEADDNFLQINVRKLLMRTIAISPLAKVNICVKWTKLSEPRRKERRRDKLKSSNAEIVFFAKALSALFCSMRARYNFSIERTHFEDVGQNRYQTNR